MPGTPAPAPRLPALDLLRGLAVMGILLMNVAGFALPEPAYYNPRAVQVAGRADVAIWFAECVLVDGKLRNIFSMLFGAGILLVLDRAAAAGRDEGRVHMRRMAVLALFGLAHGYLLWWGDILFQYAVVGGAALLLTGYRARTLAGLGVAALLVHALLAAGTWAGIAALRSDPNAWAAIAAEVARMHGGYAALLRYRTTVDLGLPLAMLAGNGFETLGMMLLGMAALRSGFVTGGWSRRAYLRVALGGYAIGLPAMVALAAHAVRTGFDPVVALGVASLWSLPFRALLALAHVALAMLWVRRGTNGWWRTAVAAVGRVALSNYLGSSLVMTTLFYGYGVGLFGQLDRLALLGIVVVAWGVMLGWSAPWLARHRHGPFEALWRRLAAVA